MNKIPVGIEIIAHRGASGYAPENTLAAFSKAILMGARAVEFDVQETKDHELVVFHDADLKRVAGDKRKLSRVSYPELADVDIGSWFHPDFFSERAPRLEEALRLLGGAARSIELHLEIKEAVAPYPGIEQRILETLRHLPRWDAKVVISSFNHESLRRVRELDPRMRLGYLAGPQALSSALKEAAELRCESVHLSLRRLTPDWAKEVHAAGKRLLVYTIRSRKDLDAALRAGADGVFSDFPDVAEESFGTKGRS